MTDDGIPPLRQTEERARTEAARRKPGLSDSRFRELQSQVNKDKRVKRPYRQLHRSIRRARNRIVGANRRQAHDDAARAAVDRDAMEITKRIREVSSCLLRVVDRTPPGGPFTKDDALKLEIKFAGGDVDRALRVMRYNEASRRLDVIAAIVKTVRRESKERSKELRRERRYRKP